MQFEPKYGRPGDGKQAWLALQSKCQNKSRQRRQTLLRRLDNSVMRPDTDPDVFLSEMNQICDERSILDETVSTERLTTTILDALPAEMYWTVKLKAIQGPDLSLEQTQRMMRTIFINHSKRVSVTKQESKRYQELNSRSRENGRESAMSTAFISLLVITAKNHVTKSGIAKENWRENMRWENQENSIMRERKSVDTIKLTVIRISSVSSKWENRRNLKIDGENWCSPHNSTSHSNQ